MNIRTRLTLRFILITAFIFLLASVLIYLFSSEYRKEDFYTRLLNKANNTAKLFIEVEEVDAELLRRIERDNPVSLPDEKIVIYDYRDKVLFSTDEEKKIRIEDALLDKIRLEEEVRLVQGAYEVLGFLFKGQYDRFVVVAAASDIYGYRRLNNLIFILFIVFIISIVIVSVSGWFYAGKALQPIARVIRQVDEISIANLDLRVDEGNGQDEIAKLAQTFNSMLNRLETSFVSQKNFISNASHELRTPLTAITGQLEVTLLNPRSTDEYRVIMNSVLQDIKSLNRLSNRLLLLAQTSAEETERRMPLIRIDELMWQSKEDLAKLQPDFVMHIDLDENLDDEVKLTIRGDEHLIRTAFSNIIENGCKYSEDKTVWVYIKATSGGISIDFTDKGIGILPEDISNIYEPFYRGANTKTVEGHGIGLSMVKGIIRLHKGSIDIASAPGAGTVVRVTLPISF